MYIRHREVEPIYSVATVALLASIILGMILYLVFILLKVKIDGGNFIEISGKLLDEVQIIMDTTMIKARIYKTQDPELSKHIEITHTLVSLRGNSEVVAR